MQKGKHAWQACFFLICSVCVGVWVWGGILWDNGSSFAAACRPHESVFKALFIEGCWEVLLPGENGVWLRVLASHWQHHFQTVEYDGGDCCGWLSPLHWILGSHVSFIPLLVQRKESSVVSMSGIFLLGGHLPTSINLHLSHWLVYPHSVLKPTGKSVARYILEVGSDDRDTEKRMGSEGLHLLLSSSVSWVSGSVHLLEKRATESSRDSSLVTSQTQAPCDRGYLC